MNFIEKLRERHAALLAERDALREEDQAITDTVEAESRDALNDTETSRHREIVARNSAIVAELDQIEADIAERSELEAERSAAPKGPEFLRRPDTSMDVRAMSSSQLVDTVVRAAEEHGIDPTAAKALLRRHARDQRAENQEWLRNLAARSTDVYAAAWAKYAFGRSEILTDEERAALAVGTNTQGGYLVPTHLDPTLILTSTGGLDKIGAISRNVTLTVGNVWNGVTSAGVTISWDGELTEVSDDTPGVDRVSIPVHTAQGFVQASIAAFEDIEALSSDVLMLFGDARTRLLGAAHATGTGSGQPTGIFTALDANTNVEIVSTTAATIGVVDLQTTKRAVPERWRVNGQWVYNPVYGDAIKNLGTALSNAYSTNLTEENTEKLLGRPAHETDWAPSTQTTTVRDNEIVYGDFMNYVAVNKPGSMSIEFIPHLFNTANNLPDGRRGWFMHFRHGADSVNDNAFRLLQDKTSA